VIPAVYVRDTRVPVTTVIPAVYVRDTRVPVTTVIPAAYIVKLLFGLPYTCCEL